MTAATAPAHATIGRDGPPADAAAGVSRPHVAQPLFDPVLEGVLPVCSARGKPRRDNTSAATCRGRIARSLDTDAARRSARMRRNVCDRSCAARPVARIARDGPRLLQPVEVAFVNCPSSAIRLTEGRPSPGQRRARRLRLRSPPAWPRASPRSRSRCGKDAAGGDQEAEAQEEVGTRAGQARRPRRPERRRRIERTSISADRGLLTDAQIVHERQADDRDRTAEHPPQPPRMAPMIVSPWRAAS